MPGVKKTPYATQPKKAYFAYLLTYKQNVIDCLFIWEKIRPIINKK